MQITLTLKNNPMEGVLNIGCYRGVILRFEQARADFIKKAQSAEKSQAFQEGMKDLEQIFNRLRYILTRYGRVINLMDALHFSFKRKQMTDSTLAKM